MLKYILIYKKSTKIYETKMHKSFSEHNNLLQNILQALSNLISQFMNDNLQYFEIKNYKVEYFKSLTEKEFVIISKNTEKCYKNTILQIYAKSMILNDINIFSDHINKLMHES